MKPFKQIMIAFPEAVRGLFVALLLLVGGCEVFVPPPGVSNNASRILQAVDDERKVHSGTFCHGKDMFLQIYGYPYQMASWIKSWPGDQDR